jgi:Flp pilus assembly protein TadD
MGRLLAILFLFGQLQTANDLFEKAQYADAIAAYENIPAAERTAPIENRLGMSYHFLNKLREAEAAYREAIKLDAKYSDAYNNLGVLYYSRKNFSPAEREFRHALEADAENSAARKNLRAVRYARESGRKTADAALEAEKVKPLLIDTRSFDALVAVMLMPAKQIEEADLHSKRADSMMARKMYDDAIVEYSKAIAIDKFDASSVNKLGLAYHQSLKIKEAEINYREAVKLNPYYVEAYNNLGTIEFLKKNYDRALDQYRKALKLRPQSSTILHNVGACLFAMQRFDEGMEVYRQALRIDPQLFEHLSGFGTLIQTTSHNDSMQNFYMAKMFAGAGDKDRAISMLYKAFEDGFKDVDKIKKDPVFADLADDERFQRLMQSMAGPNGNGSK